MSNPNCPDCKQPSLPRVTKPDNAQNPNRVYYLCQNCPGKDGRGGKFLGWADGKNSGGNSSAEAYKKRKFEEKENQINLASQDPLKTATALELLLFQKLENIEKMLRGMAPLKKANSEVPNFREKSPALNLYAPELSSREETTECY